MAQTLLSIIPLIMSVGLFTVGLLVGRFVEKAHYRSIHEREAKLLHIPITATKTVPDVENIAEARLVYGSVVISIDHFKRFLAGIRKIFGGEMRSYSSLVDRARREALLRMKETYPHADIFMNCRIETCSISKGNQRKAVGSVEVMAYATAIKYRS